MRKILTMTAATLLISANAAVAEGGKANNGLAGAMADSLKGGNATIGGALGGPGKGTASAVSGKNGLDNGLTSGKTGGWGNVGSSVAGGGQVSNRDDNRGQ